MPSWDPTVAGNTRSQQRQIDKIGTARMGPVSIGPGDGHIRYYDESGRTVFRTDSSGAMVYAHDALRPLGGAIESKAAQTYVDGNIATLVARDNEQQIDIDRRATRTYVDGNITTLVGRDNELQADINTRASRTYVDGNVSTIVGRLNGLDSEMLGKASTSWVSSVRSDLQGQLDGKASTSWVSSSLAGKAAVSYVDTVNGRANAARNRADAAYSLAQGRAAVSYVDSVAATARQYTDARLNALVAAIRNAGLPLGPF